MRICSGNDPSCDVAQTEPVPEFTTVASLLQAAVQASTTENSFFPFPVAAATVLASMALALMQLQQSSSASVAGSALTTAEILIQHAEERLKLQQIETLRSLSPTEEAVDKADHDRLMSSRGPTEYPHCPSTRYSAGHLGVLHQVRLHLYYALHNPALLSFVVTVNTISLKEPRENHCALGTWIHNFHEIVATRARELACLLLASLEPRLPSAACKQTPN